MKPDNIAPIQMTRRAFVGALSTVFVFLGGCLGEVKSGGFSTGGSDSGNDSEDATLDQATKGLRKGFEERGLDVLGVSTAEETIVVRIQTSGDLRDDLRRAAGAYATAAPTLERDLTVRVEDRGLVEETFRIKLEWARQFASERLSDREYLERVNGTRKAQ